MTRARRVLAAACVTALLSGLAPDRAPAAPLWALGVDSLQARLADGRLSSVELVRACLARIDSLDRRGPALRAVLEINPDAPEIAAALDEERRARGPRGPLHGIPVLLKGNIDTGDRLSTTAGSLALAGHHATRDAFLVTRLREAGAVILGKTNLSEWANFRSTRASSGWSSQGGQTRNPHDPARSPCGSSSGSAVALAAGYAPLAVGTETDGSIVCPAGTCGVVGLKPTLGLVSRAGVIPIAHSQDTAGPMARSARDAALLLQALAAHDSADAATQGLPWPAPDYAAALGDGRLEGLYIGVVRDFAGAGTRPEVEACYTQAVAVLQRLGARVVDPVTLGPTDGLDAAELEVLLTEFKADLAAYLGGHGAPNGLRGLDDLILYDAANHAQVMPWFAQELFEQAAAQGPLTDPAYREALATGRRLARNAIDGAIRRERLDLLIAPTNGPAWAIDVLNGDNFAAAVSSSTLPAVAGYPALSVPMGQAWGLPLGLTLFGSALDEPALLRAAHAFETAVPPPAPPDFQHHELP